VGQLYVFHAPYTTPCALPAAWERERERRTGSTRIVHTVERGGVGKRSLKTSHEYVMVAACTRLYPPVTGLGSLRCLAGGLRQQHLPWQLQRRIPPWVVTALGANGR